MGSISGITSHTSAHTSRNSRNGFVAVTRRIVIALLIIVSIAIFLIDKKNKIAHEEEMPKLPNKDKEAASASDLNASDMVIKNIPKPAKEGELESPYNIKQPHIAIHNYSDPKATSDSLDKKVPQIPIPDVSKSPDTKIQKEDLEEDDIYVVESGDTLEKISLKHYQTSVYAKKLMDYNKSDSFSNARQLRPGQSILVPSKEKLLAKDKGAIAASSDSKPQKPNKQSKGNFVSGHNGKAKLEKPAQVNAPKDNKNEVTQNNKATKKSENISDAQIGHYIVKKGESLYSISRKLGISLAQLFDWNAALLKNNPDSLQEGMILSIGNSKIMKVAKNHKKSAEAPLAAPR
ncbi:MAG: LysM peptidoglycan-binding domain-containing protein [Candidatus Brocadiae bacterium]|nr:LysM peptidoglycan-binding domain-containing protein [Candidatus Brocadiia bacterium]